MTEPATSYDAVPYPSYSFPQTHPDRLATLATLFGLTPAPVEECRVLELGCAGGGNLIPMAEQLPGSLFVGIDLSARQIDDGRADVQALGLKNIILDRMSIPDVPADAGPFDYIIAHGVYSWVPPEVQTGLLRVCKRNLAPNGVAYVSYSTYPGYHARRLVREIIQYHTRHLADPTQRLARGRELLAFLADGIPPEFPAYRGVVRGELERLRGRDDAFVLHDELAEDNAPAYFHEFMERAAEQGLQFLAEADVSRTLGQRFSPPVSAVVDRLGGDVLGRQQYLDFLTNSAFRETLLCHADLPLRRDVRPEQLRGLLVASCARCPSPAPDLHSGKVEEFRGRTGVSAATGHALSKAAFVCLEGAWPRAVSFDELEAQARARLAPEAVVVQDAAVQTRDTQLLAENLLQAVAGGVAELHVHAPRLEAEPPERPRAAAFARLQAGRGTRVTNLRHETMSLDEVTCSLLRLLDGTCGRADLLEAVRGRVRVQGLVVQQHGQPVTGEGQLRSVLAEGLEANLSMLARSALLLDGRT